MVEEYQTISIKNLIYEVRNKKVMLDSDVAYLFGYETKDLNRNVRNNINRFPENYCFKLTKEEYDSLRCKNFTLKSDRGTHRKYLPYVFTEYGITMLAGLLKSEVAVKASIKIVNEFIEMKKLLNKNDNLYLINDIYAIKNKLLEHDDKINELFNKFDKKEEFKNKIFFDGEIYDAYSLLIDIIRKANDTIIIIDNYVDKVVLDILTKKNINVVVYLITDKSKNKLTNTDILKFNREYPKLKIKYTNKFHDRFIIIDKNKLYHLGASLKDLGNKVFAINKIDDVSHINMVVKRVL